MSQGDKLDASLNWETQREEAEKRDMAEKGKEKKEEEDDEVIIIKTTSLMGGGGDRLDKKVVRTAFGEVTYDQGESQ
jgi:hypothetical protein